MKNRQWLVAIGLLVLVLAAVIGSILTSDLGAPQSAQSSHPRRAPLVDEGPLNTARSVAKLASSWDEKRFADQALRLADNEVDLAFEDALRDAADHPIQPTPETRDLYAHVSQGEADVKADQDRLDQLKKQPAKASGPSQDTAQQQLDLAQAQLQLDQDELDDAKEDLARSGADPLSRIQRQLKRHNSIEHSTDAKPASSPTIAEAASPNSNLWAHFVRWRALRASAIPLQQASDETVQAASKLSQTHDNLEKQVAAEKASRRGVPGAPPGQSNPNSPPSNSTASTAITSLRHLSDDQKHLSDLDKRIQDHQELETNYANWIAMVRSQQRAALHGMIQSTLWILLIILLVYLADRFIDHMLTERVGERTRLHTLRVVIRSSVQAVGLLLTLLVVFGAPSQTPTILGLAGAGLTVAMKDFIVAFFGWFVLMGKNGLRVGDWVEINGVAGEVVEINLLRTVLLETGNWTETGHPTGRKVAFVNNYAIEGHFFNFSTSGQWMWDELQITVPPNQDPILCSMPSNNAWRRRRRPALRQRKKSGRIPRPTTRCARFQPRRRSTCRPTSTGVEVHVRYIAPAQERSAIRARLNQSLVELLHHRDADKTETMSAAK